MLAAVSDGRHLDHARVRRVAATGAAGAAVMHVTAETSRRS